MLISPLHGGIILMAEGSKRGIQANFIMLVEDEIEPHKLTEKQKAYLRQLLRKYDYNLDLLEDCVDIAVKYLSFDEEDNVCPESIENFLTKISGIARNKTLHPIEEAILHMKNICNKYFSYFDYQKADEIIRSYVDLLKEIGYTEEEITEDLNDQLNRICRNSRNWSGWKEAIYDRMDFLMKANGLK